MTDAPERIYMDPDIKFPDCEKRYGCDIEYIRADAAYTREEVERLLEAVASTCANTTMDMPMNHRNRVYGGLYCKGTPMGATHAGMGYADLIRTIDIDTAAGRTKE